MRVLDTLSAVQVRGLLVVAMLGLLLGACSTSERGSGGAEAPGSDPSTAVGATEDAARGEGSTTQPAAVPDLSQVAQAAAPGELADLQLPESQQEVRDLMGRMPSRLAGLPQVGLPGVQEVGYGSGRFGPSIRLRATDLGRGEFFPSNWSAGHVIAATGTGSGPEGSGSAGQPARSARRDGDLLWAQGTTTESAPGVEPQTVHTLIWGQERGSWVFSAVAESQRQLEALVGAFATAVADGVR